MRPNVAGTAILLFGFEKLVQLNRLKNSVRNSPRTRSPSGINLTTEKSRFFCPGPYKKLRGVFPNGLSGSNVGLFGVPRLPPASIGRDGTNAAVLKY